ncbi:MAG: hypothetical protein K9G30_04010 [Parvibaculum sp.]|nr:hypothetical protein [Parvibaculum sp.]
MALFFDQDWFDGKLREAGATRDAAAAALHLSRREVDEIWKDQRELTPDEVGILARLLGAPAAEVVKYAGIATPMPVAPAHEPAPGDATVMAKLDDMDRRLSKIERAIADLQSLILATRNN